MQGPLSLDKIRDKPYVVVSDDVWRKFPAPQREVGQHPLPEHLVKEIELIGAKLTTEQGHMVEFRFQLIPADMK